MRFSIVVPTLNQASFLPACLDSLLAQKGTDLDLEILVLDGGSTDGSVAILERYGESLDHVESREDGGQTAALRRGFELATGTVLGWLNSDDFLIGPALRIAADWFRDHPASVGVYGDAVWVDELGKVIRPKREIDFDYHLFAFGYCYIPQPSMFFTATAYENTGGLDSRLECAFDYDLWFRLAQVGPIGHIPIIMSGIRDHPQTKTNRLKEMFEAEHRVLRSRYLDTSDLGYWLRHRWALGRRIMRRAVSGKYRDLSPEERARVKGGARDA